MTISVITRHISQVTGIDFDDVRQRSVGGGCINTAYVLSDGAYQFFVKTNRATLLDMFAAEYAGLEEIAQTHTIKVPQPVCFGADGKEMIPVVMPAGFKSCLLRKEPNR